MLQKLLASFVMVALNRLNLLDFGRVITETTIDMPAFKINNRDSINFRLKLAACIVKTLLKTSISRFSTVSSLTMKTT